MNPHYLLFNWIFEDQLREHFKVEDKVVEISFAWEVFLDEIVKVLVQEIRQVVQWVLYWFYFLYY